MASYLLSFTHSSQVADPDGAWTRVDLDNPVTTIPSVATAISPAGAETCTLTVSSGFTHEIDSPVLASGVDENFTEWTDSARWIADNTDPYIELDGLPPNSFVSLRIRSWRSGDATAYNGCDLNGKAFTVSTHGSSTTNRNEVDVQGFIGADGKLRLTLGTTHICAIQISTSVSIPSGAELIGLFMKPYAGNASSNSYPFAGNSFSFAEMKNGHASMAGQDVVSGEGNSTLLDADGNVTPYVVHVVNDIWDHGASGNGGVSYGGLDNDFNSGYALSSWTNGVDNGSKIKIRHLPVGKKYRYFVTGQTSGHRDTDFWVNGQFKRYDSSAPSSHPDIPTAAAYMLEFTGTVPESGELVIEWKASSDTYATSYYGQLGGSYLVIEHDSDVKVTRGSATISTDATSVTLTAGVDYVAPSDTSRAYLRITGAQSQGAGSEGSEFNGNLQRHGIVYANPESLDTSIIFERYGNAGAETVSLTYEIVEYVGEAGGANEFIVRHNEVITFTTGVDLTKDSAAITGIVNPADCIPFLNGAKTSDNGRGEWEQCLATGEVFEDKVTLDRAHNSGTDTHSLTLVEFIGSNYTVQRVSHTYVGNGLETETVSVTDYTKTALYVQQRGADLIRSSEVGDNIWLSDNTTLNFDKYAVESGGQTSVVWMLENPYFQVSEYSGTITGSGTATPASGTITIADVGLIDSASIFNVQGQLARNSEDADHAMISMSLTDSTTVSWSKGMGMHDITYRFQVLEWPVSIAAGYTTSFSFGSTYTPRPAGIPDHTHVLQVSGSNQYPIAYDNDGIEVKAGWSFDVNNVANGGRNRSSSTDNLANRLWQINNHAELTTYFRLDLPRSGLYNLRLLGGDPDYAKRNAINVKDGKGSVFIDRPDTNETVIHTAIGEVYDAAGNIHLANDWRANNEPIQIQVGGALYFTLGSETNTSPTQSALNYVELEYLGDQGRVKSRAPQYFKLDGDLWSGSNFYNETTVEIAPDTNCLAVRAGGSIGNIVDITIGGVSLVLGDSQSDGNSARVDFYYLMNPPTGSLTLRIDGSASSYQRSVIINELSGVDTSATPLFSKSLGYNTARTTTVNGGDGSFIASASTTQDAATLGYDQSGGNVDFENKFLRSGYAWSGYSQSQVGSGDVTVSTTQDLARFGAVITGAFAYASGAGGGSTAVENSLEAIWNIYQETSGSLDLRFNILQAVENSVSIDWNLLQSVVSNVQLNWQIFNSVEGSLQIDWNMFGIVAGSLGLEWNLLQAVDQQIGLDWNVLQKAESGVELRFNILQQASQALGIEWNIFQPVERSVQILWNNLGALNEVSAGLSIEWSILNSVEAALAAEWNILQSVGVDLELRHNIAQHVAQSIEVQFNTLNAVEQSIELTWNSIESVNGVLELNWTIQIDEFRSPIHQMIIVEEGRIMTILGEGRKMTIQ